jgi:acetoin utilization protein AcuB
MAGQSRGAAAETGFRRSFTGASRSPADTRSSDLTLTPDPERTMRVADLMTANVQTVFASATIREVIVTLADSHISAVPVLDDEDERPIGVISTTDILQAEAEAEDAAAREELFERTTAQELMTPRPLAIASDARLREAAQQMLYADVRRLLVVDGGRLVGIVSQTDIVRAMATARSAAVA